MERNVTSVSAEMWTAAVIAAVLNGIAHVICRKRAVSTLARHIMGVFCVLVPYSLAYYQAPTEPVLSAWVVVITSGVVVGLLYTFWHPAITPAEQLAKEFAGDDVPQPFSRYHGGERGHE